MKFALNKYDFKIFSLSQLFAMNTAAPDGALPRRIDNREHF